MRADIHDGQGAKHSLSMDRIQMRETNYLQIATSILQKYMAKKGGSGVRGFCSSVSTT
jgi:hypothetical protein